MFLGTTVKAPETVVLQPGGGEEGATAALTAAAPRASRVTAYCMMTGLYNMILD